ncbi:MAG: lytic transglycosylase domain-containing protein [bacterium]|nr:lytic transglycosylase domain-containing protein [bacterium]
MTAGVIALMVLAVVAGWTFLRWQYPLLYEDVIRHHAAELGLDPMLVAAVIRVESRFRPDAVSPKGALGLMQVMPDTGRWIASQFEMDDFSPEMLLDPFLNIRFGTWYLAHLQEEFRGDTVMALAAYNGGRSRVREWARAADWIPGEGRVDGEATSFPLGLIPQGETRDFVIRVVRDHSLYRHLYRWWGDRAS